MTRIPIAPGLSIDQSLIVETFLAASGPGGQNVNKVSSAVQMRFDAAACDSLDDETRARLAAIAGRRMTREGELVILARNHRTQERNRAEALERLVDLIRRAAEAPRKRRPTRPTRSSVERRREEKRRRGRLKASRAKAAGSD